MLPLTAAGPLFQIQGVRDFLIALYRPGAYLHRICDIDKYNGNLYQWQEITREEKKIFSHFLDISIYFII